MEKRNTKLALMSMITITLGLLLMNVGRLEGYVPDWTIRTIGIITMLCAGLSVFFTVRELANHCCSKESKEDKADGKE